MKSPNPNWKIVSLDEVSSFQNGHAFYNDGYAEDGLLAIDLYNISEEGKLRFGNRDKYVDEKTVEQYRKFILDKADIVIVMTDMTQSLGILGKNAIVDKNRAYVLNQRIGRVVPDRKRVSTKYLHYYMNSTTFLRPLYAIARGAVQKYVNTDDIKKNKIVLPPLPTQLKIAAIISSYDDLIENNLRRVEILEEMAQSLYNEWFVRFRFPGHETVRMVDSPLGRIPEDWEVLRLGDVISYSIGGGWGKEDKVHDDLVPAYVIRGTDIPSVKYADLATCPLRFHKLSNLKSRKIEFGDIIFEVSGGSKDQPLGRSLLVSRHVLRAFDADVICASFCKLLRVNKNIILPELVYLHFLDIYHNREIMKYQVQSTGLSNFKFSYFLENEPILIPSKETQVAFNQLINPNFDLTQSLGLKNQNLRSTRDLLLPKLISGELDVSDMDIETGDDE